MSVTGTKTVADGAPGPLGICAGALLVFLSLIRPSVGADTAVTASLNPAEIALGQQAHLTVTCNMQGGDPQIPDVPGLSFQHIGQSSRIQFINGAMSANVTHTYLVTADRPGVFSIPPIRVGAGPNAPGSQPLTLRVHPAASGATPQSPPQGAPSQAVPPSGAPDAAGAIDANSIGFLRMETPKTSFVVGETVPVQLRAFFREGVELRVDGPPKFNSDAFTMKSLGDQPARQRVQAQGVIYTMLTWPTTITAVKAGSHEMALEIPTTVTVRTQVRRPSTRRRGLFDDFFSGDPFDDPFVDRFFGSAEQRPFALRSEPLPVSVSPPPTEGKPDGFDGAVGRFEIAATATPLQANAGDPVTFKVTITGQGNFDRVSTDGVARNTTWKSYKPMASFQAGQDALSGAKTFEQALVPLQSGRVEIPAVPFSYFEPDKQQYVTIATQPITIEVAPGQTQPPPVAVGTPPPPGSATQQPPSGPGEILPDKVETGPTFTHLRPWFFEPGLMMAALAPTVFALALWLALRRHIRLKNDVRRKIDAETRRHVREQLAIMKQAAARGAAPEFFAAARDAFRHHFSAVWGIPAGAITLAELDARGNGEISNVRQVFELADEAIFAGRTFKPETLVAWLRTVDEEINRLEAMR